MPHSSSIIWLPPQSGQGDMGDVADENNGIARITPGFHYILESLRLRFKGSGDQGTATLQMILDHEDGGLGIASPFDWIIDEWDDMGFDSGVTARTYVDWSVPSDKRLLFSFHEKSAIVLEWTDPGTTLWGYQIGVSRA